MSDELADLTLTVFLLNFRRQLVEYRRTASIDLATPGQVLDAVVTSIDLALKTTKGDIAGKSL